MISCRWLSAAALCGLLAAGDAAAQVNAVQPGQRVRLTLSAQPKEIEGSTLPQVLRGQMTRALGDSLWLVLHPGTAETPVSLAAIEKFDVSGGVEQWWESAWRRGRKSALVFGLELFLFRLFSDKPFDNAFEAGIVGAGLGLAAGGVMGVLQPQEVWHPLPWPSSQPARTTR